MKNLKKYSLPILVLGFFAIWAGYDTIKMKYYFQKDSIEKRYSIAEIYHIKTGTRKPPLFEYIFKVNNREYKDGEWLDSKTRKKFRNDISLLREEYNGTKYLVKFVLDDPDYSELLWNKPIKDSTIIAPANGWKKLPF